MSETSQSWKRWIQPGDSVWLAAFAVLVATALRYPYHSPISGLEAGWREYVPLIVLCVAQILEPKIPAVPSLASATFWIVLKLAVAFYLMGYTGTLYSDYWPMILLPMLSGATGFSLLVSLGFTTLSIGTYALFLLFESGHFTPNLAIRLALVVMVGNLANMLAKDLRVQSEKSRRTAEQLAEANRQLREAEEAARRADRLAALGQLTAGLAHELRNPLGTIRASAELLQKSVSENEVSREMAGFIASEVDRTNSLVTRFLQFARPLKIHADRADLAQTLDRAIGQVEREAGDAAIYKNYAPEIAPFPFDAELMERVFYNLILNAVQASPPGGPVSVKTRAIEGGVEIDVIDRGSGIDPKQLDTIFNPFFTTKKEGVGLGLAIVSKIVDEHGGKITVESEPAKGSVFRVLLPHASQTPSAPVGTA